PALELLDRVGGEPEGARRLPQPGRGGVQVELDEGRLRRGDRVPVPRMLPHQRARLPPGSAVSRVGTEVEDRLPEEVRGARREDPGRQGLPARPRDLERPPPDEGEERGEGVDDVLRVRARDERGGEAPRDRPEGGEGQEEGAPVSGADPLERRERGGGEEG